MSCTITIVTPSYNQAPFLEETLRSVLSQRDQIDEYFVFDGGSTDGSAEIIQHYAEQGGIDYWHSRKDTGQGDAIHQGFERATGDWVAWLNSDDIYLPGALARIRQAIESHPDWDALTGHHIRIDAESRIISQHRIPSESSRMMRWGVCHVCQQTCFFRRELYNRVGGINQSLHCVLDTEMWYRMSAAGAKWGHIPEYLAAFRVHAAAKGSSWDDLYAKEERLVDRMHPKYRVSPLRHFGLAYYRFLQSLSGRHVRGLRETRQHRGRKWDEVFPGLPAQPHPASA